MNTNFTNKTEYLIWRDQWKTDYAKLSDEIRDLKFARWFQSKPENKVSEAQTFRYNQIAKRYPSQYGFYAFVHLRKAKAKATEMLEIRKQSKVQAQEQYLAAKALQPAS